MPEFNGTNDSKEGNWYNTQFSTDSETRGISFQAQDLLIEFQLWPINW